MVHAAINRAIDRADDCPCVTRNGRRVIGSKDNERLAEPRCAGHDGDTPRPLAIKRDTLSKHRRIALYTLRATAL